MVRRREVPDADLAKAAAVEGIESELTKHYQAFLVRKPMHDIVKKNNENYGPEVRKECCAEMLALYESGKKITDAEGLLFVEFWRMSFDGALHRKDHDLAEKIVSEFEKNAQDRAIFVTLARSMREDLKSSLEGE